jgi:hypothetical protein
MDYVQGMPWVLSCLGIGRKWLLGEKNRWGWALGIFTQLLWLVWMWKATTWGFLPLFIVGMVMNVRNFIKWS